MSQTASQAVCCCLQSTLALDSTDSGGNHAELFISLPASFIRGILRLPDTEHWDIRSTVNRADGEYNSKIKARRKGDDVLMNICGEIKDILHCNGTKWHCIVNNVDGAEDFIDNASIPGASNHDNEKSKAADQDHSIKVGDKPQQLSDSDLSQSQAAPTEDGPLPVRRSQRKRKLPEVSTKMLEICDKRNSASYDESSPADYKDVKGKAKPISSQKPDELSSEILHEAPVKSGNDDDGNDDDDDESASEDGDPRSQSDEKHDTVTKKTINAGDKITCEICNLSFTQRGGLASHVRWLHRVTWAEYITGLKVDDPTDRKSYFVKLKDPDGCEVDGECKQKGRAGSLSCPVCKMVVQRSKELAQHIRANHKEAQGQKGFWQDIEEYEATHAPKNYGLSVKCPICDKVRFGIPSIKRHMKVWHNKEEGWAGQCEKTVTDMQERLKNGPLHCPFCNSACGGKFNLAHHIRSLCLKNPARVTWHHCPKCASKFASAELLLSHVESRHTKDSKEYVCEKCGKSYVGASGLLNHKRSIHGIAEKVPIRKHVCPVCNKVFTLRHRFDIHILSHSDVKTAQCDICGKRFKADYTLRKHRLRMHKNSCNYRCERCGHGAQKKEHLKRHRCQDVESHLDKSHLDSSPTSLAPSYSNTHNEHSDITSNIEVPSSEPAGAENTNVTHSILCKPAETQESPGQMTPIGSDPLPVILFSSDPVSYRPLSNGEGYPQMQMMSDAAIPYSLQSAFVLDKPAHMSSGQSVSCDQQYLPGQHLSSQLQDQLVKDPGQAQCNMERFKSLPQANFTSTLLRLSSFNQPSTTTVDSSISLHGPGFDDNPMSTSSEPRNAPLKETASKQFGDVRTMLNNFQQQLTTSSIGMSNIADSGQININDAHSAGEGRSHINPVSGAYWQNIVSQSLTSVSQDIDPIASHDTLLSVNRGSSYSDGPVQPVVQPPIIVQPLCERDSLGEKQQAT